MTGWHILLYGAACGWGALSFLKLVADEIELTAEDLRLLDERERRAYERHEQAEGQTQADSDVVAEKAA